MFRIVLFGPPLSGKSEIIRQLQYLNKSGSTSWRLRSDEFAPIVWALQIPIADHLVSCETIPGCPWDISDWDTLLNGANAILFVVERHRTLLQASITHRLKILQITKEVPKAVLMTKADLARRKPKEHLSPLDMQTALGTSDWPVFVSGRDDKSVYLEALSWLVRTCETLDSKADSPAREEDS